MPYRHSCEQRSTYKKWICWFKENIVEELNERIQAFDYGLNNRPNIPSGIKISKTSNSIGQHAAQTLCLITFLPLIIKDTILKIKQNDYVKWYMILLLIKMLKIALAPKITLEMLQDLETSTTMHHNILINHFSLSEEIKITVGKRIKFMGSELLKNKFICTTFSNNLPIFSRSVLFFSIYDELFVICESWKTIDISTSCLGYLIVNNSKTFIQKISDLPYTKNWQLYETSDKQFVIPTEYFL
ncbi:Protein of unknown function [Cotesia congregata]|uniref:Uncharacterized protein n=1 Tax=Cotesia congregata TaxID=51543 RepID=A0A8J2H1P1_COTCN|nr:Protein of unknown function [Cotesia congregata]